MSYSLGAVTGRNRKMIFGAPPRKNPKPRKGSGRNKRYQSPFENYVPDNINWNLAAQANSYRLPPTGRAKAPRRQARQNVNPFSQQEQQIDLKQAYEGGKQMYQAGKKGFNTIRNRIHEHKEKKRKTRDIIDAARARSEHRKRYGREPGSESERMGIEPDYD